MDIELTSEQQQLQSTARRLLEKACTPAALAAIEKTPLGYPAELWREMAALGWTGLPLPESHGGSGLKTGDVVVLAKELGRVLLPSPYLPTVMLAGAALAAAGSPAQQDRWLPGIVSGETTFGFALQEAGGRFDGAHVTTTARRDGDGVVLNGAKRFVEYADSAHRLLVVARTGATGAGGNAGLSMFLVDPHAAGVTLTPLTTVSRDRQCNVRFDHVRLGADSLVGPWDDAWSVLDGVIQRAAVAFAAAMTGAAERSLELATDYAKQRVQFGKPIGSFMTIHQYLAQMAIEATAADTLVHYAAWHLDEGRPARAQVARAKLGAGNAFQAGSAKAAVIYGGMGFVEGVDITNYLRRGKQWQLSMGDTGYWEDVLAEAVLDA